MKAPPRSNAQVMRMQSLFARSGGSQLQCSAQCDLYTVHASQVSNRWETEYTYQYVAAVPRPRQLAHSPSSPQQASAPTLTLLAGCFVH